VSKQGQLALRKTSTRKPGLNEKAQRKAKENAENRERKSAELVCGSVPDLRTELLILPLSGERRNARPSGDELGDGYASVMICIDFFEVFSRARERFRQLLPRESSVFRVEGVHAHFELLFDRRTQAGGCVCSDR
jgi:hypothetical protein